MSLLGNLINAISGSSDDSSASVERPCSNCESSCEICPNACEECKPYKEQLLDALYNVEHLEDFYAKYEVVSEVTSSGTTECPYCGAPSANAAVCEYCGMTIGTASGKIQVKSASEIPNPITEAQNIIFERQSVISKYKSDDSSSGGLLSGLISALSGSDDSSSFGSRMSEDEIKAMAEEYDVTIAAYLSGLDAGTYLTKSAKEKADALEAQKKAYSATTVGVAGAAGVTGAVIGNRMASNSSYNRQPPPQPNGGFGGGIQPGGNMNPGGFGQNNRTQRPPEQPVQKQTFTNTKPVQQPQQSRPAQQAKKPAQQAQKPVQQSRPAQQAQKPAQQSRPAQQTQKPAQSKTAPSNSRQGAARSNGPASRPAGGSGNNGGRGGSGGPGGNPRGGRK